MQNHNIRVIATENPLGNQYFVHFCKGFAQMSMSFITIIKAEIIENQLLVTSYSPSMHFSWAVFSESAKAKKK